MGKVLVLGGGAAGMVAAWRAASTGHRVLLVEGNGRLGVKLRISGGGKCNVTHAGEPRAFLAPFDPAQARFLRPAIHAFDSEALRALLQAQGVETYVRENGRVFPTDAPGSAGRVVSAFEGLLREAGVEVHLRTRAAGLQSQRPRISRLALDSGSFLEADHFILATGGASYPETGTRGEVLGWLQDLGLPVHPWEPALAPILLREPHPAWEGVALRGGRLELRAGPGGRRLAAFQGDLVFTRNGISGPAALELSQATERARRNGAAWLSYAAWLDSEAALEAELQDLQRTSPHLAARTWLQRRLPERLCAPLAEAQGLLSDQRMKDLPRSARKALVALVCALPLGVPKAVPLDRGEVAAGGLSLKVVNPKTMVVSGWDNLRVCGELLDVNGPVGGYNLQAAFSTGYLAGTL